MKESNELQLYNVSTMKDFDEILCSLLHAISDHERMVGLIIGWGVRLMGLLHSPKTNGDCIIKGNQSRYCPKTYERAKGKKERWCRRESNPGPLILLCPVLGLISDTTFLSFPLPFERSSDSNGSDCLWLDNLHWSLDCGGVLFIRLPMPWFCSPSFQD